METLLDIESLRVSSQENKSILMGIDLKVRPGEVHAVMGTNGSGKSTLSQVLAGSEAYTVQAGRILYRGRDLLALSPEERAQAGLFLAFQYPASLPGVNNMYFLRAALNSVRKAKGEFPIDAVDFLHLVKEKLKQVDLPEDFLYRAVNDGFSGGEKKRNEILQMLVLAPQLIILDEIDSGLDIDALQVIAKAVNALRDAQRAIIVITHYQRLLKYIVPDHVHVLLRGQIVRSGDASLVSELEEKGYGWLSTVRPSSVAS